MKVRSCAHEQLAVIPGDATYELACRQVIKCTEGHYDMGHCHHLLQTTSPLSYIGLGDLTEVNVLPRKSSRDETRNHDQKEHDVDGFVRTAVGQGVTDWSTVWNFADRFCSLIHHGRSASKASALIKPV